MMSLALIVLLIAVSGATRAQNCSFNPNSPGTPIPEGFGANIDFTEPRAGEMKMLAESGVRWVRMDFKWDLTEQQKGTYDFAPYDRLMSALQPFGLKALFILDYGNPLYDQGAPPRTEATRQAFARWAVAAAKHFSGRGVIWELYNEPNNAAFWSPRPNATEYAALARTVAHAFRVSIPNERLIGPAVGEMDFSFLEACFKSGALESWSAVSVHPYLRSDPEMVTDDYCRLRELIKKYVPVRTSSDNVGLLPIISSEWGYSSIWEGMNEEKQGRLLARQWLINVASNIHLSIWYNWRDDGLDPNDPEHHFGMVSNRYHEGRNPVYDPKPTYLAARTLSDFFRGFRFERRLETGNAADYVLVFRLASSIRIAAWTTEDRGHNVLIPLNSGLYRGVRYDGQGVEDFKANQKGLSLKLTSAPIYVREL